MNAAPTTAMEHLYCITCLNARKDCVTIKTNKRVCAMQWVRTGKANGYAVCYEHHWRTGQREWHGRQSVWRAADNKWGEVLEW